MSALDCKPKRLARFPWATLGRAEMAGEFWQKVEEQKGRADLFVSRPSFSLILVLEDPARINQCAMTWESLRLQSYPHWRALVAAPAALREKLALPDDPRFQFLAVEEDGGLPDAKNRALEKISEGWVGVIGIGDVLSPAAFYQFASEIERDREATGFYCHEVQSDSGKRREFHSKASWSPWTLAHWNCLGRFWVLKRSALTSFEALENRQDEQVVLLRAGLKGRLRLVPFFLYYGPRQKSGSLDTKTGLALAAALSSGKQSFRVEPCVGRWKVTPVAAAETTLLISAIVCFRNRCEMTLRAVRSLIERRGSTNLEIILVDNGSSAEELAKIAPFLSTSPVPLRLVHFPGPFNYGRMHNWAIREHCRGSLLLFLNNDVLLKSADLNYWSAWAQLPEVASAGILLRFEDGRVQHAGIRAWFGGEARMVRLGNSHGEGSRTHEMREVFANTFAACMVKRAAFETLGGLRETELVNGFGDVAFCFEAVRRGWKHVYLGAVEGTHAESTSRGRPYEYWEEVTLERDYPEILQRMLREDWGINRVPGEEDGIAPFLVQALKSKFRRNSRWLDPLKPSIKRLLGSAGWAGDNGR